MKKYTKPLTIFALAFLFGASQTFADDTRFELTEDSSGNITTSVSGNGISSDATSSSATASSSVTDETTSVVTTTTVVTTTVVNSSIAYATGGVIYNEAELSGDIEGTYSTNIATNGGVIYNATDGTITGEISGVFTGNGSASATTSITAVTTTSSSDASVEDIVATGDTTSGTTTLTTTNGGAIYNTGTIGSEELYKSDSNSVISGTFTSNSAATGGAIYNSGDIYSDITGKFISNTATTGGSAIYNSGEIYGDISAKFTSNTNQALYNSGDIYGDISGDFVSNIATAKSGGAIYNSGYISSISGDFIANRRISKYNTYGGAIYNASGATIDSISSLFLNNYSLANGGAIWNAGTITITGGDFIYNSSGGANGGGGGAIQNTGTIYIESYETGTGDDDIEFTGNTGDASSRNAIANEGTVYLNAYDDATITMNDKIGSVGTGIIYVNYNTADAADTEYSTVSINNEVANNTVTVYNGTLELGSYAGTDNLYQDYFGSDYESILAAYYSDYSSTDLDSYISTNYGTVTLDASSASFSSSALTVNADASLSIKVSSSTDAAANAITFANTTLDLNGQAVLDLSDILSSYFSITLTFSGDTNEIAEMFDFLTTDLDVIFADGSTLTLITETDSAFTLTDDSASYTGDAIEDLSIELDEANGIITISGTTTAVPEPSTYAMIFGLFALGFAAYRRRK